MIAARRKRTGETTTTSREQASTTGARTIRRTSLGGTRITSVGPRIRNDTPIEGLCPPAGCGHVPRGRVPSPEAVEVVPGRLIRAGHTLAHRLQVPGPD